MIGRQLRRTNSKMGGPYKAILSTLTVVKLKGHSTWTHISRIKLITPSTQGDNKLDDVPSYSWERMEDFKFKKKK